jgi:pyruvate/oxaloacetate carboxyltransferase
VPIEIRARCNTGLAPLAYLESIKIGTGTVHTAVSPLANGSSLPFTGNILKNTRRLGYLTNIDEDALKVVSDHFMKETTESGVEQRTPPEHDVFQFEDQVPGGLTGQRPKNDLCQQGIKAVRFFSEERERNRRINRLQRFANNQSHANFQAGSIER